MDAPATLFFMVQKMGSVVRTEKHFIEKIRRRVEEHRRVETLEQEIQEHVHGKYSKEELCAILGVGGTSLSQMAQALRLFCGTPHRFTERQKEKIAQYLQHRKETTVYERKLEQEQREGIHLAPHKVSSIIRIT